MQRALALMLWTLLAVPSRAAAPTLDSYAAFEQQHLLKCMAAPQARSQPVERQVGGQVFVVEGGRITRRSPAGPKLVIGVLSAIKEAEEETRANLARAAKAFREAGVEVVIANGDIALNQFDLEDAMNALGELGFATFVLIGNSESRGAFNRAFVAAEQRHPNLFNLNWSRHVQLGSVELLAMPGYHDRVFIPQSSGCRYTPREVEELGLYLDSLQTKTPVLLVAHGPPRSTGPQAIDLAFEAGNVGDPELTRLIDERAIAYGVFGHILEAGGRASVDLARGKPARPGKRQPRLYLNAGAASATPWGMHDGGAAQGLAAIVTIDAKGASYQVLKLR